MACNVHVLAFLQYDPVIQLGDTQRFTASLGFKQPLAGR